jgi:hypothetical protein
MNVEGPSVITRQPAHIRWIGYDQTVDLCSRHGGASFCKSIGIFWQREIQRHGHLENSLRAATMNLAASQVNWSGKNQRNRFKKAIKNETFSTKAAGTRDSP